MSKPSKSARYVGRDETDVGDVVVFALLVKGIFVFAKHKKNILVGLSYTYDVYVFAYICVYPHQPPTTWTLLSRRW